MQSIYKAYESEVPLEFNFVNEASNNLYREDKRVAGFILLFTCMTIFIGCLGLFGLTLMAAEIRVKEIGIRKVLGASVLSILGLLSKDFFKLLILATVIAIPIAWYVVNSWLQNFAFRIQAHWWVFFTGSFSVISLALLTIIYQAARSGLANPVKSLKAD